MSASQWKCQQTMRLVRAATNLAAATVIWTDSLFQTMSPWMKRRWNLSWQRHVLLYRLGTRDWMERYSQKL